MGRIHSAGGSVYLEEINSAGDESSLPAMINSVGD